MGRLPDAVKQYEKAVQFNPDFANAYVNLAKACFLLHRSSEAIAAAQKAADIARAHGQTELAQRIEASIATYRQQQATQQSSPPSDAGN
jgi:tetratricopeptide (TPR) repeat protein